MSFKFLKAEKQFLETGLQTPRSGFFRNPFLLEVISRNHFLLKLNGLKQGLRHRPPFLRYIYIYIVIYHLKIVLYIIWCVHMKRPC
jgi:hypothetical protein